MKETEIMGGMTLEREAHSRPSGLNPGLRVIMSPVLTSELVWKSHLPPWSLGFLSMYVMRGLDDSRSLSPGQPRLWSRGGYRMGGAHLGSS